MMNAVLLSFKVLKWGKTCDYHDAFGNTSFNRSAKQYRKVLTDKVLRIGKWNEVIKIVIFRSSVL